MKHYRLILFMVFALMLTACGDSEETEAESDNSNDDETESEEANANENEDAAANDDGTSTDESEGQEDEADANQEDADVATNEDDSNEENDESVAPSDPNDNAVEPSDPNDKSTVDFQRINFMMGSPDHEPEPGIWLYTEDDHAEGDEDMLDLDEYDVLHYQIDEDDYLGYDLRAQQIVLEDDGTARIIVDEHREPRDSEDEEDYEMPRQYLNVEKGELRDKNFIVEMENGETLNLE